MAMMQTPTVPARTEGNATPTSDTAIGQQETLSREKRRIQELEEEIEQLRSRKEVKRSNSASVVNKGRAFRRVVALFHGPNDLVREYDRRADIADQGLDDPDDPFPHSPSQDRAFQGFQEFIEFFPWIKAKLTSCEPVELDNIFKELRKGADGARGDDAASMKKDVVTWLVDLYGPLEPPISPFLKSDRGLDHDITGRLLCPIEYDWDDAEVKAKIRDRHPQFLVTEDSWPRFLYDTKHRYDPDNLEKGLFRSTLLLKAFKSIFTSPSSAQEITADDHAELFPHNSSRRKSRSSTDRTTRENVAAIIGMRTVKPRAIAYAAVQLRFALSSLTCWRIIDGDFDAYAFYSNILDYFQVTPGPAAKTRVQNLLLWWDRKVFGKKREITRAPEVVASSSVWRLASQRSAEETSDSTAVASTSTVV